MPDSPQSLRRKIFVQLPITRAVHEQYVQAMFSLDMVAAARNKLKTVSDLPQTRLLVLVQGETLERYGVLKRSSFNHKSTGDFKFCWIIVAVACNKLDSASGFPQTKHFHSTAYFPADCMRQYIQTMFSRFQAAVACNKSACVLGFPQTKHPRSIA